MGTFLLTKLDWEPSALEPAMSARTLQFHHGIHHAGYVAATNRLILEQPCLAELSPLEVVRQAAKDNVESPLFRNAAQAWNHDFFWRSLMPVTAGPSPRMIAILERCFGGLAEFANVFADAGMGHFGAGWLWLIRNSGGELQIVTTTNADTPAAWGEQCLLTIDLWEHAYYLDHQNRRREYLEAIIKNHLNWTFADSNFNSGT